MPPKSGHQRAKTVDYDEDDVYSDEYDESYEDDGSGGMTDEDREQMRIGTKKVREALGPAVDVSETQIQEALWHYYYDVGKSVTYLKNKFASSLPKPEQQAKKQKAASRFDQAASAAVSKVTTAGKQNSRLLEASACTAPSLSKTLDMSFGTSSASTTPIATFCSADYVSVKAANFFWDTPWGNVPYHRTGMIKVEPLCPRAGLLGGSSKLAALAAKRKQKQEEVASAAKAGGTKAETDRAVALLDRLSVKGKENTAPGPGGDGPERKPAQRYPNRKLIPSPKPEEREAEESTSAPVQPSIEFPGLRAEPSMFASTLCSTRKDLREKTMNASGLVLPYPMFKGYGDAKPFAGPSPDDIVLRAQARGTATGTKASSVSKKVVGEKLAESIEKLAVEESPKVKSKNLNVVEEFEKSGMKRMANFVVIGHVDHGKSTLMGRLLYDLKVIDQRSLDKLRKEAETIGKSSFALAWVMDQTAEERSRGVTVDIATTHFETSRTRFTILDAPGHKDFIPNMIAGASQADFAVLVIDASTNSFESGLKGQTKEHALLVRSMGVQRLIVVINKMDTVFWSQARFAEISAQMSAFLTSASFSPKQLSFIPCAGLTGENVTRPVDNPAASWYAGLSLLDALDAAEPAKRSIQQPLRMTIADVFRGGITTPLSVSGRIDAGAAQVGDTLLALPANQTATIRAIELDAGGGPADWTVAGQIPTLHLADIDPIHLRQGDILCAPAHPVPLTKEFSAKILAFEHVLPMSVDVFRGRLQAEGRIVRLLAVLDKSSGAVVRKKPRIVKPGEVARVVVALERELPLEKGTRVVLREGGNTVAAGLLE